VRQSAQEVAEEPPTITATVRRVSRGVPIVCDVAISVVSFQRLAVSFIARILRSAWVIGHHTNRGIHLPGLATNHPNRVMAAHPGHEQTACP
jgi:hypothetical protein